MLKEVIVVEGRDDTRRLREIFGDAVDTIETNGSAIDEETLALIQKAHDLRGVIVLTDPDFPGEKIRQTITQRIPTVKHAFLTVDEAKPKHKGSLGVEHASGETIKQALARVQSTEHFVALSDSVDKSFLLSHGLIGLPQSAKLRNALSRQLRIGHVNGKQLEKRLQLFGISKAQVQDALQNIKEETNE